jgi:RNA polymerase sigma-70 factor, ECF subfamily
MPKRVTTAKDGRLKCGEMEPRTSGCDNLELLKGATEYQPVRPMSDPSCHEITSLLTAWCAGEQGVLDRLMPLVYEELHRAAQHYMRRENSANTMQAAALIQEVYLRLVDDPEVSWQNRSHFLAVCARMMRRILVDRARSRRAKKRGAGSQKEPFDEAFFLPGTPSYDLLALDEALNRLKAIDNRKSQVVEWSFFGGLSGEESAEVLKVSTETVKRDWRLAKVWFLRELTPEQSYGA